MSKIGIVADDLTGATTVGVLLARAGVPTAAYFEEDNLVEDSQYGALLLSTDSRSLPKSVAQHKVKSAVRGLKNNGAIHFSKRIDTTLRGGIGAEIEAMLDELDSDTIAIMVPSMPQSNRVLVGGYSLIDSVPLSKTPVANDVKTPVNESHCPTLIAGQTGHKIGSVPLQALLSGKKQLIDALQNERSEGAKIIIVDAITIEDVDLIAESVHELEWNVLAVDPGPFTEKLATYKGYAADEKEVYDLKGLSSHENTGTVLAVAGSATPTTKTQLETLLKEESVIQIPVSAEALIDKQNTAFNEVKRAVIEAIYKLNNAKKPNILLLETSLSGKQINLKEKEQELSLQPGEASENINLGLGEIVNQILSKDIGNVNGIYMTGGDTMVHVLRVLGAKGIELIDYVIPQADLGRIIGSKNDGMVIVGKGGLTGSDDTAISIIQRIVEESYKAPVKINKV